MIIVSAAIGAVGVLVNQDIARLQRTIGHHIATGNIGILFRPSMEADTTGSQRGRHQSGAVHRTADQGVRTINGCRSTSGNTGTGIGIAQRSTSLATAGGSGLSLSRLSGGLLLSGPLFGGLTSCGFFFGLRLRLWHIQAFHITPAGIVISGGGGSFGGQVTTNLRVGRERLRRGHCAFIGGGCGNNSKQTCHRHTGRENRRKC